MGLAASQARLLSITSRMADNELRSQLINNAKMRLTTDSSRVSDEYIAALNKTQMMFTNFDTNGNEVYQDLTFNALTSYSAYNTQYGIVNTAGQIIVSNTDATRFERSANLEEFLEQYGLEKKTEYFDTIANSPEYIEKGIGYYDNYGVWQQMNVSIEEMQDIYEGNIDSYGVNHYGEADSLHSVEYGDYEELVGEYRIAKDYYKSILKKQMKNWIAGDITLSGSGSAAYKLNYDGKNLEYYYEKAKALGQLLVDYAGNSLLAGLINNQKTDLLNAFYDLANDVGFVRSGNSVVISPSATNKLALAYEDNAVGNENDELLGILNAQLEVLSVNAGTTKTFYNYTSGTPTGYASFDSDGNFKGYITSGTTKYISDTGTGAPQNIDGYPGGTGYISTTPDTNSTKVLELNLDESLTYEPLYLRALHSGETADYTDTNGVEWKFTYESDTYYSEYVQPYEISDGSSEPYEGTLQAEEHEVTADEQAAAIEYLFEAFRNNLLNNLSEDPFKKYDTLVINAFNEYKQATVALANFIYGDNATAITTSAEFEDYLAYFDDPSWILSTNSVIKDVDNDGYDDAIEKSHLNPWAGTATTAPMPYTETGTINGEEYTISYQAVKDLFLLECMQNHYGTPNYKWIDNNNPNENGEAKAQWYTNLYEKMKQGYKRIGDGLGNNQEWMQFAFESGLVHMEQVNQKLEWIPTLYSNCSTIVETTVDVDITLAEAKYKREMNKIQAKDKQYDIQLKNIDTEHEALKQEYDTIKEVINKNIDRNFKLFTQG